MIAMFFNLLFSKNVSASVDIVPSVLTFHNIIQSLCSTEYFQRKIKLSKLAHLRNAVKHNVFLKYITFRFSWYQLLKYRKQSPGVFCKKRVVENFTKLSGIDLKKRVRHRNQFRYLFSTNTSTFDSSDLCWRIFIKFSTIRGYIFQYFILSINYSDVIVTQSKGKFLRYFSICAIISRF